MKRKKLNKVPLKYAIESGAWYECISGHLEPFDGDRFRMKVLSFEKVNLAEVDEPEKIGKIIFNIEEGDFWIMKLEVINLSKTEKGDPTWDILIIDQGGYEYNRTSDVHLSCDSNYAQKTGLYDFFGKAFFPKIKRSGAINFFLPKEKSTYFLSVKGGNIQEV